MAVLDQLSTLDVVISSGQSVSAASGALDARAVIAVITPAAWTAAGMTFQKSMDGVNFFPVSDRAGEVLVAAAGIATAAATWIDLDPALFCNARYVKVVSGTRAALVAQGAARTVSLVLAPVL